MEFDEFTTHKKWSVFRELYEMFGGLAVHAAYRAAVFLVLVVRLIRL